MLSGPEVHKLGAILARLTSPHTGEIVAAATAASRFLGTRGMCWQDLAAPLALAPPDAQPAHEPDWRAVAAWCQHHHNATRLSDFERDFLAGIVGYRRLSPKQRDVLERISVKLRGGAR